ncbi:MAG: hypothetical protein M0R77_00895 [Gammaproteobacteria bacterium]|nr:hypothetical protein [Acholeplasmataceae bacterium]MCK9529112.1 hypothetical protein [Gammaproteobacteria bacterium]
METSFKFVLLDTNHNTEESDWGALFTVEVEGLTSYTNKKVPVLFKSTRYHIDVFKVHNKEMEKIDLNTDLEERIKKRYEESYLFGKKIFTLAILR